MSTWHYGIVARWWAEFNHGGPEVEYFRPLVASGQPALDAGCGTGRLLLPYLREGLDVDGCDVSPDMLAHCRAAAEREGLSPNLYTQALHELDLPRRYRTIVACGVFGLGSTRAQDEEALGRLLAHLEPGGLLALDTEARWRFGGLKPSVEPSSERSGPPSERRRGADGAEYALASRLVEVDRESGRVQLALHAWMWREGELTAEEEHVLTETFYERDQLTALLERTGFVEVEVTAVGDMLVYSARRPV